MPISYYVYLGLLAALFFAAAFLFVSAFSKPRVWWNRLALAGFAVFLMVSSYAGLAAIWFDP